RVSSSRAITFSQSRRTRQTYLLVRACRLFLTCWCALNIRVDLVLPERIEFASACHRDGERPQRVPHLHAAGMLREHLRQPPIGHRTFVKISADQHDAAGAQPIVHFGALEAALGLLTTMHAPRTMNRRVEQCRALRTLDALNDDGVVTHAAADKATLAGKG